MAVETITLRALKTRLLVLLLAFVIACWLVPCPRLPPLSDGIPILRRRYSWWLHGYSTAPLSSHPIAVSYSEKRTVFVRSIYPAWRWSARDGRISCGKNCFGGLEIVKALPGSQPVPASVYHFVEPTRENNSRPPIDFGMHSIQT